MGDFWIKQRTAMCNASNVWRFCINLGRNNRARALVLSLIALSVVNLYYLNRSSSLSRSGKKWHIQHYEHGHEEELRERMKGRRNKIVSQIGTSYLAGKRFAAVRVSLKGGSSTFTNLSKQFNQSTLRYNISDANESVNRALEYPKKAGQNSEENQDLVENEDTEDFPVSSSDSVCPQPLLTKKNRVSYGTCEPHKATNEACKLAEDLYYLDPSLSKCKWHSSVHICSLKVVKGNRRKALEARCNPSACEAEETSIGVYAINPLNGFLESVRNFSVGQELEKALPDIVAETVTNKFPFLYLKCLNLYNTTTSASQLLPVTPRLIVRKGRKSRQRNVINVNILLIDSVSRAHFYRSLPKTTNVFKTWADEVTTAPARVFDFELFQAVDGHTAENTHALFTGKFLPPYDHDSGNTPSVEMDVLFGHYKRAGYQTMWQEDLCWKAMWGLMTDLYATDWNDLLEKTREAFIDQTGLTHSSCELLASLGVDSPFNGPSGDQICYNGMFQHSYFLQYTRETFKAIASSSKALPLLNYFALNVAHDDIGRRTQTLDPELADYVTAMAHDRSTLTIILADHGNTYTSYTSTLEGRFEMFHPSLFVIVPNRVAKLLGEKAMSALRTNQRRLVTIVDLHHSLMSLAGPLKGGVTPQGLFAKIGPHRTCRDVELRTPNLCVCEGWDSPTTNDSSRIAVAEFAIGQLNNLLQAQYAESVKQGNQNDSKSLPIVRSCQRLQPLRVENMRERNAKADGSLVTSMDIYVAAGNVVRQKEDVFHIEVKSREINHRDSLDLELVHYDRLTLFGRYKICADDGVQLKICVCSRGDTLRNVSRQNALLEIPWNRYVIFFSEKPELRTLDDDNCVSLLKRSHGGGLSVVYEVANICRDTHFVVSFDAQVENMRVSRELPFKVKVPAGSITFAMSARVHIADWKCRIVDEVEVVSSYKH